MTEPEAVRRRLLRALLWLTAGAAVWVRLPFVTRLFHGGDYGWLAQAWRLAEPDVALRGGWRAFHLLHGVLAIPFAVAGDSLLAQSILALAINVATTALAVLLAYEMTRSLALSALAAAVLVLAPAWALASNLVVNNPAWGLFTAAAFLFLARRERTGAPRDYALSLGFALLSWFVYVFGALTLAFVLLVGAARLRARLWPYALAALAAGALQTAVFGFDWSAGSHRNLMQAHAGPPPFLADNARLVLGALLPGFWNWSDLALPRFQAEAVALGALTLAGAAASPAAALWAALYLAPFALTPNVQSQHAYYALPAFALLWTLALRPLARRSGRAAGVVALALAALYGLAAWAPLRDAAEALRARAGPLHLDCVDPVTTRALRALRPLAEGGEPVFLSGPIQGLWPHVILPHGETDQARGLSDEARAAFLAGGAPEGPAYWLDVTREAPAEAAAPWEVVLEFAAPCAEGGPATARVLRKGGGGQPEAR